MARRKSTSKRKNRMRTVVLTRIVWIVWSIVTGGSVAGWMIPSLPLVGPIVQSILGNETVNKALNDDRVSKVIDLAPDQGNLGIIKERLRELRAASQTASNQGIQVPTAPGIQIPTYQPPAVAQSIAKPSDAIRIASYNIQVFGATKMQNTMVIDILAQVIRHFDIVAIQEIRSKDDQLLPTFVATVNADGSRYDFVIGPRLGRTAQTEQYAFVYDTNRIEVDRSSVSSMSDPSDALHREPLVARFRTRTGNTGPPFSFWLVNIHTDPDEVPAEINVLAGVFQVMQTAHPDEDDVILLGDLNASDREFGQLGQLPGIAWAVTGTTTNTRKTKMYDNILFSRFATTEYTGRWGVVDIQSVFGLTLDQALQVSDHLPVWAEFRAWESPAIDNTARMPGRFFQ